MNYTGIAEQVYKAILRLGSLVTLVQETAGENTFDAETGMLTPVTNPSPILATTTIGYGVLMNYSDVELANTSIRMTDKKMILAAEKMNKPNLSDRLTVAGTTYEVISVRTSSPGGTDIYYEVQLR
jgi:hypothetical protein